ncbi:MAG: hypothetical protein WBQ25_23130 [Nitrososphaeraceae archaeon]
MGDKGNTGEQGPPGPAGPTSDQVLNLRQVEGDVVTAAPGFSSTASCSSDEKVTGGGYTLTNNLGPGANVVSSKAVGNSWEVRGTSGGGFIGPTLMQAFAECAKLTQ